MNEVWFIFPSPVPALQYIIKELSSMSPAQLELDPEVPAQKIKD